MPFRGERAAQKEIAPLAEFFRALADPNRLQILRILMRGETTEKLLVSALDLPQPRVSRHLAHLRRRGMVRVERRGRYAYCSLAEDDPETRRLLSWALAWEHGTRLTDPRLSRSRGPGEIARFPLPPAGSEEEE